MFQLVGRNQFNCAELTSFRQPFQVRAISAFNERPPDRHDRFVARRMDKNLVYCSQHRSFPFSVPISNSGSLRLDMNADRVQGMAVGHSEKFHSVKWHQPKCSVALSEGKRPNANPSEKAHFSIRM
jgi:hypothetical protein